MSVNILSQLSRVDPSIGWAVFQVITWGVALVVILIVGFFVVPAFATGSLAWLRDTLRPATKGNVVDLEAWRRREHAALITLRDRAVQR